MRSTSVAVVPRTAEAAARLRSLLWSTFACWQADLGHLDDAALVLSELVGNAVRHAAGDSIRVQLRRDEHVLRIVVSDGSPAAPVPREAGFMDESGRGLFIIEAVSHRWGWEPRAGGKVVWADVAC